MINTNHLMESWNIICKLNRENQNLPYELYCCFAKKLIYLLNRDKSLYEYKFESDSNQKSTLRTFNLNKNISVALKKFEVDDAKNILAEILIYLMTRISLKDEMPSLSSYLKKFVASEKSSAISQFKIQFDEKTKFHLAQLEKKRNQRSSELLQKNIRDISQIFKKK